MMGTYEQRLGLFTSVFLDRTTRDDGILCYSVRCPSSSMRSAVVRGITRRIESSLKETISQHMESSSPRNKGTAETTESSDPSSDAKFGSIIFHGRAGEDEKR